MTDAPPSLTPTGSAPPSQPRTPAISVWSLVLGILSIFCLWILGSIPAIILGIIGIKKANQNPQEVGGKGLALAGIITGGVGILTGLVTVGMYAAMVLPAMSNVQDKAQEVRMMANLKQVSLALQVYELDNKSFPESLDELVPDFLDSPEYILQENPDTGEMAKLLYEPLKEGDNVSETAILLTPFSSNGQRIVGYADGSVLTIEEPIPLDLENRFK